jgi:hypothetical protein
MFLSMFFFFGSENNKLFKQIYPYISGVFHSTIDTNLLFLCLNFISQLEIPMVGNLRVIKTWNYNDFFKRNNLITRQKLLKFVNIFDYMT